jgi:valyl-tRNA synthetase
MFAALDVLLRLFAPFLPFAAEEAWSWWRDGSVHGEPWPVADDVARYAGTEDDDGVLAVEVASHVLSEVRKSKSEAQRPLKTPVRRVLVRGQAAHLSALALVESDLRAAGLIERLEEALGDVLEAEVELADAGAAKGASV